MLAEAMVRLSRGKPDRKYATPTQTLPDILQGLQNYMRLFLRGHDAPMNHQRGQSVLQPIYQQHPVLPEMWQAIVGGQAHPGDLAMYLDQLNEHGGIDDTFGGLGARKHVGDLVGHLHDLMYYLGNPQLSKLRGQQYSPRLLAQQPVLNAVGGMAYDEFPGANGSVGQVLDDIRRGLSPRNGDTLNRVHTLLEGIDRGEPGVLPDVYDFGHLLSQDQTVRPQVRNSGLPLASRTQTMIHRGVLPLLEGPRFSDLRDSDAR